MKYTLENGKVVNIPDNVLEQNMKALELTKEQAIELWLEDNDYQVNEEQAELDEKAKKVKIQHDASGNKPRKAVKDRIVKVSDEKKELFTSIVENLTRCMPVEQENIKILKENKLIEVKIGEKVFKIDLIEQRKPKN